MKAVLSAVARQEMQRDINACPYDVETAWAATWDSATNTITSARFVVRGAPLMVGPTASDFRPGELFVHSHPRRALLEPSEADIEVCKTLASIGVGCAITNRDLTELFLMRPPGYPALVADSMRAAAGPRYRVFRLGRLALMWRRTPLTPLETP